MTPRLAAICREHFGVYRAGRWSPPNRCDSCPLRAPCMVWGAAPAHTDEQLREARAVFERDALAVIG